MLRGAMVSTSAGATVSRLRAALVTLTSSASSNSELPWTTAGTPRSAAATAPATASGSCTITSGRKERAAATARRVSSSFTAPNSSATPRVPPVPLISARAISGWRSMTLRAMRPKSNPGAMLKDATPAGSPSSASPPVATRTS